jgi:hypothetical protein
LDYKAAFGRNGFDALAGRGFVTGRRLDVGQDVGAAAADAGQILANLAKAMI